MGVPSTFFLLKDNQPTGPYSIEKLKQDLQEGLVSSDDLVWARGMSDWTQIRLVILADTAEPPGSGTATRGGETRKILIALAIGLAIVMFVAILAPVIENSQRKAMISRARERAQERARELEALRRPFGDPERLCGKSIGPAFAHWWGNNGSGWGCSTSFFEVGLQGDDGLRTNVAYYVIGNYDRPYVEYIDIKLNLNNPQSRERALTILADMATDVCSSLSVEFSYREKLKIVAGESFQYIDGPFTVSFRSERFRILVYDFKIESAAD